MVGKNRRVTTEKLADQEMEKVKGGASRPNPRPILRSLWEGSVLRRAYAVTEEQIKRIMDEVLVALNQESILVEAQIVEATFYRL